MRFRAQGLLALILLISLAASTACFRSPRERAALALSRGKQLASAGDYARAILEFKNAVAAAPNNAEAFYQLGAACIRANRLQEGVDALHKATVLNPKHAAAQLQLSELMLLAHDPALTKQADQRLHRILTDRPGDTAALYALAAVKGEQGKLDDAERYLRQVLEKDPRYGRAWVSLATLRLAGKDPVSAEAILRKSLETNPRSADSAISLAMFYIATGKPAKGEILLRQVLGTDPGNASALTELAVLEARSGRYDDAAQTYRRISSLPGTQFRPAYGLYLLQRGDRNGAVAEFERLFRADPNDRATRSRLVAAYAIAGRVADAEALLNSALKNNPRDVRALVERGRLSLAAGKIGEARDAAAQALHYERASAEAHFLLADTYRVTGSTGEQRQELSEALRIDPGLLPARLSMAAALLRAKDPAGALAVLDAAPNAQKNDLLLNIMRNWARINRNDRVQARKFIDAELKAGRSAELLLQDGVLRLSDNDYAGAKASLEESLRADPDDQRTLQALAAVYIAQNQPDAAIAAIRKQASLRPPSAATQMLIATLLLSRGGRDEEVRFALQAAKAAAPADPAPDLELAKLDMKTGRLKIARASLERILQEHGENANTRLMLGMIAETEHNTRAAIGNYRRAVDADPANVMAINNLAYSLAISGATKESLKYAQRAKELAPNNPYVQDTLGWAYYKNGLYRMAVRELEAAAARDNRASIRYHLGLAYRQVGDAAHAAALTSAALKEHPELAAESSN